MNKVFMLSSPVNFLGSSFLEYPHRSPLERHHFIWCRKCTLTCSEVEGRPLLEGGKELWNLCRSVPSILCFAVLNTGLFFEQFLAQIFSCRACINWTGDHGYTDTTTTSNELVIKHSHSNSYWCHCWLAYQDIWVESSSTNPTWCDVSWLWNILYGESSSELCISFTTIVFLTWQFIHTALQPDQSETIIRWNRLSVCIHVVAIDTNFDLKFGSMHIRRARALWRLFEDASTRRGRLREQNTSWN